MLSRLILTFLGLLPFTAQADMSLIVTSAENAIVGVHHASLAVSAFVIAVLGGVFVFNLIMKILKGTF